MGNPVTTQPIDTVQNESVSSRLIYLEKEISLLRTRNKVLSTYNKLQDEQMKALHELIKINTRAVEQALESLNAIINDIRKCNKT